MYMYKMWVLTLPFLYRELNKLLIRDVLLKCKRGRYPPSIVNAAERAKEAYRNWLKTNYSSVNTDEDPMVQIPFNVGKSTYGALTILEVEVN